MSSGPSLPIKRPTSVFVTPIKADGKGLFKSLVKALSHVVTVKHEELIADFGETVSALGLGTEPGQMAWLLIRRALEKSMLELVKENADLFSNGQPPLVGPIGSSENVFLGILWFAPARTWSFPRAVYLSW